VSISLVVHACYSLIRSHLTLFHTANLLYLSYLYQLNCLEWIASIPMELSVYQMLAKRILQTRLLYHQGPHCF